MAKFLVRVVDGYRWSKARIGGRDFDKGAPVTLAEHEVNDEVVRAVARGILEVEEVGAEIDATEGALALAEVEGVDLAWVEGSGKDGRVIKRDVEVYLGAMMLEGSTADGEIHDGEEEEEQISLEGVEDG